MVASDPGPLTVGALARQAAGARGDYDYVVTPTDRLSYADAEARSARAARFLLARGVGKGGRVGLFFTNDTEWITWWLAVSRIGAVAVPLSTLYTPAEIAKVLRLADVGLLVAPTRILKIDVAERFETALPGLAEQSARRLRLPAAPYLRQIVLTGETDRAWATRVGADDDVPAEILAAVENEVTPADLAIMIHTSGTTADPKGVLHTHGTLVRQTSTWPSVVRRLAGTIHGPRVLCAMPFFWIGGLLAAMGALHAPATLLVLPRLEAGAALDLAERERANAIVGWPAFTQQLREHPTFPGRDLSSAPLLTQGPLDLAMADVPDGFPIHRSLTESGGSFAFTDVAIVDEAGSPVSGEAVGELLIRGVGAMTGYNKRERHEVFDADGWYHTGDQVYRKENDPRLFYVGRATDLIKAAGANVSPLEVAAVVEALPDVAQCFVLGVAHPSRGEEVCAVVVPAGDSVDVAALTTGTRAQLSSYKVPTRWIVATSADIPTLPSGKLDRRTLGTRIADGTLT
jgi:acyl-CoA synthetase (AMP-forming)/AMP-acid ligase II